MRPRDTVNEGRNGGHGSGDFEASENFGNAEARPFRGWDEGVSALRLKREAPSAPWLL